MSEGKVKLARRFFGFWPDRDFSGVEEFIRPDTVIDMSRNVFNPAIYRGFDGFRDWVAVVDETWDNFRSEPEEFVEVGDALVTAVRVSGIGRASGVQTEMLIFGVWRFHQGKVARYTGGFRDRDDALEAAGMSEENLEVVERAIAAINERDIEGYLACCTEDIQLRTPLSPVEGVYEGADGIRRFFDDIEAAGPDFRLDLERSVAVDGERVLAFLRITAHGRASHVPLPAETGNVYEFEEGKIRRIQIFLDRGEALEAAGLRE